MIHTQGYTYSVFNLVYETNVASCRIWDALGFKRIGRIKACGNLRSRPDDLVDAIIYGRDLGPEGEDFVSEERFDKIRFYLKHGKYPNGADRAEKSRLRSAATHYKLLPAEDGNGEREGSERLMLKDKEVVSDPQRQYQIARQVHVQQHGGINKTTATIAEKFHWVRIKETVSLVIKNCPDCKESAAKAPTVRPNGGGGENGTSTTSPSQLRKAAGVNGQTTDPNSMIERLVNFDAMEQPSPPPPSSSHNNNRDLSISRSPELDHAVPVANMRALQEFVNIPLDPQIIQQQQQQQLGVRRQQEARGYDHRGQSQYGMEFQQQQRHDDTRMATERHVRQGDEPMAYQDGSGMLHDHDPDESSTVIVEGDEPSAQAQDDVVLGDGDDLDNEFGTERF